MDEEQIIKDLTLLLSFAPALNAAGVVKGLCPTFYFTGSYETDLEIVSKIENIVSRYNINIDNVDDIDQAI